MKIYNAGYFDGRIPITKLFLAENKQEAIEKATTELNLRALNVQAHEVFFDGYEIIIKPAIKAKEQPKVVDKPAEKSAGKPAESVVKEAENAENAEKGTNKPYFTRSKERKGNR